jgi:hypothetical protein
LMRGNNSANWLMFLCPGINDLRETFQAGA